MRKFITPLLLFSISIVFIPVESKTITQNHIDAEVQIVCTDGADNCFSGLGV